MQSDRSRPGFEDWPPFGPNLSVIWNRFGHPTTLAILSHWAMRVARIELALGEL